MRKEESSEKDSSADDSLRSSSRKGQVDVQFDGAQTKRLVFSELGGMAIFEGDICLGSIEYIGALKRSGGLLPQGIARTGEEFRWRNGVVPFEVADGFVGRRRINDAVKHWSAETKLRFVEIDGSTAGKYPDFLYFEHKGGCWSYVGRQKSLQTISIGEASPTGSVIHEIGHAVGLWHEHTRSDRDRYITIVEANIDPANKDNFDQPRDGFDIGEYDYGSIMHYSALAFSANGKPTIIAKGGKPMGQRDGLSAGDIAAVREIYSDLYQ